MEKNLRKLKVALSVFFLLIFSPGFFAQVPSVVRNIRINLWAELDAYPMLIQEQDDNDDQFDYPIRILKETAPFIIGGMVYGWEFYYTPSDIQRNVEEILEVTEIVPADYIKTGIQYSSPWVSESRLNCWCDYRRSESQVQNYYLWSSIQNPVVQGRGYGSISLGFEGLRVAAKDALKNAIRDYYRNLIKNKPKAITGKVLIRQQPQIGIDAGRYMVNLDFFLESGKIIQYEIY
ncbi:MAG: hypothetical protein J1E07_04060 [Treponema sp.]|nr:hypothetical protein [Treponema sp.]